MKLFKKQYEKLYDFRNYLKDNKYIFIDEYINDGYMVLYMNELECKVELRVDYMTIFNCKDTFILSQKVKKELIARLIIGIKNKLEKGE